MQLGLIAVTAATLLMMAWAIFPTAALAVPQTTPWSGGGAGFLPCTGGVTTWTLYGFGPDAQFVSDVVLTVNGQTFSMSPGALQFSASVPGPGTAPGSTTASATWEWNGQGAVPTAILDIKSCTPGTTTTTPPPTTTTPPPTTTTPPPTTTTPPPTTTTSPPPTTTTPPPTTTTPPPPTTTSEPPTVSPTTITPPPPTTTRPPGGTAFTGVQNVVPLGAIALLLLTTGSGLMWAGSRRRKSE